MRSKHIYSLASAVCAVAVAGSASADVTRLRVVVDDLPLQDTPLTIDAKSAVLPSGTKDHGPVPKSWRKLPDGGTEQMENSRCTDDRRGSVGTIIGTSTSTRRIWEADGKIWLDTAYVDTTWGHVEVTRAERVPLARIADGVWGFRRKSAVVLVTARDIGFIEEGGSYECGIHETEIAAPAGTAVVDSSPKDANEAKKQIALNMTGADMKPKWTPEWVGVEYRIMASVSKSSADPTTTLSLVVKRP
jgi:hypothetical protein